MTRFYDINGVLSLSMQTEPRNLMDKWITTASMELDYFQSPNGSFPDMDIRYCRLKPNLDGCVKAGDSIWIRPGYVYFKVSRKLAQASVEISNTEEHPLVVRIDGNVLGRHLSFAHVIESLISILLEERGSAKVHASGVAKENKGLLIAGLGGSGKTSIALELIREGYAFLGDDSVILSRHEMLPFPKWLHIFRYHIDRKTPFDESLSWTEKAMTYVKWLLSNTTSQYAKLFTFISPSRESLGLKICRGASLAMVFVLQPGNDRVTVTKISSREAASRIAANDMCELSSLASVLLAHETVLPDSRLKVSQARHQALLTSAFEAAECRLVCFPSVDSRVVEAIQREISVIS